MEMVYSIYSLELEQIMIQIILLQIILTLMHIKKQVISKE
nr:MAG TPA: hypothetical protein [Caudoviricetes sp.]